MHSLKGSASGRSWCVGPRSAWIAPNLPPSIGAICVSSYLLKKLVHLGLEFPVSPILFAIESILESHGTVRVRLSARSSLTRYESTTTLYQNSTRNSPNRYRRVGRCAERGPQRLAPGLLEADAPAVPRPRVRRLDGPSQRRVQRCRERVRARLEGAAAAHAPPLAAFGTLSPAARDAKLYKKA